MKCVKNTASKVGGRADELDGCPCCTGNVSNVHVDGDEGLARLGLGGEVPPHCPKWQWCQNRPSGPSEKQPSESTHSRQLDRKRRVGERIAEVQQAERPNGVVQLGLWLKTANSSGQLSPLGQTTRPRIVENYFTVPPYKPSFRTSQGLIVARASPVPEPS